MKLDFQSLLGQVTDFIKSEATTKTVVGEEFKLGEFSCVPIIKVNMGFGTGGGEGADKEHGHGEGGGAGAGVNILPMGFLVSKGDNVEFIAAQSESGIANAFEKVPDLISKYLDQQAKSSDDSTTKKVEA